MHRQNNLFSSFPSSKCAKSFTKILLELSFLVFSTHFPALFIIFLGFCLIPPLFPSVFSPLFLLPRHLFPLAELQDLLALHWIDHHRLLPLLVDDQIPQPVFLSILTWQKKKNDFRWFNSLVFLFEHLAAS